MNMSSSTPGLDEGNLSLPAADGQNSSFKTRIAQFKYSPLRGEESLRRSPRISTPRASVPAKSQSASPSPWKRSRQSEANDDEKRIKLEEELESDLAQDYQSATTPRRKKQRSTTKQRSAHDPYNPVNNLVDSLRPGLRLVCIGLNPGLMTASTGHAYAHPSNRFWHLLYESGVTPKKHLPAETRDLMDLYQIGNTNICARPTRSGDGLSKEEMLEGAAILEEKISLYRPEAVVIVGKSIWETIWMAKRGLKRFKDPNFHWGWQDEDMQVGRTWKDEELVWPGAKTFVATSTSGLAATMRPAEKLAVWKPLGDWMTAKQEEPEHIKSESE